MGKFWGKALMLLCAGLVSAPLVAQDATDVGRIERGGSEDKPTTSTKLDKTLSWETSDGKFKLGMNTRVQFRYTFNDERGQGSDGTNGRDFSNFRVRRVKTSFGGHIFAKEFQYAATFAWTNGAGQTVEVATFTWAADRLLNLTVGQAKTPWNWQQMVSSGRQQFVDRSVAEGTFNHGFAKGITLSGALKDESATWIKYWAGVYNGVLRANNDFRNNDVATTSDSFGNTIDSEMMLNFRVETHPLGELSSDGTDQRSEDKWGQPLIMFGLAVNWMSSRIENNVFRPGSGAPQPAASGRPRGGMDALSITFDAHLRVFGLSVDFEFYMREVEFHYFGSLVGTNKATLQQRPGDLTDLGMHLEVGYMIIPKTLDVAVRYGMVNGQEFYIGGVNGFSIIPDSTEVGLQVGYHLGGHNLKLQADVTYVSYQLTRLTGAPGAPSLAQFGKTPPARSASSISNDVSDYLNVWQFRMQLQWIF